VLASYASIWKTSSGERRNSLSSSHYQPPVCLAGQDLEAPSAFSALGGEVVVFTHSSPALGHSNEDAVGVFEWEGGIGLLVVADGLGGLPRGGETSKKIIEGLRKPKIEKDVDPVISCLQSVNNSLITENGGSGTTVSIATIEARRFRSYHVGDSAMLVSGQRGRVKFQTTSHSPVGIAEANSQLDEKAAMFHPNRHVINNMIGMSNMWVDVGRHIQLAYLDIVIIASDGLWDNLYRGEVIKLMCNRSLMDAAVGLVKLASERMRCEAYEQPGKSDDLSFVLYRPKPLK